MILEGGRLRFLAPELSGGLTANFRTTQASDMFALAMTFLNVWTREPPFGEIRNEVKVASNYRKGYRPKRSNVEVGIVGVKENFWALLVAMWAQKPADRPSSAVVYRDLGKIFHTVLLGSLASS